MMIISPNLLINFQGLLRTRSALSVNINSVVMLYSIIRLWGRIGGEGAGAQTNFVGTHDSSKLSVSAFFCFLLYPYTVFYLIESII
jgi:hypothetical protein